MELLVSSLYLIMDLKLASYTIGNIETVARCKANNKMQLQEVGCGGIDRTDLAQDRDRWLALLNVVMNLGIHKLWGIS
jgi:hypothetical protein